MGEPTQPTEHAITEAIALAREAIDAVAADTESWFDLILNLAKLGIQGRHSSLRGNDQKALETAEMALFVMMQELVRARPLVLTARAEPRLNDTCSDTLRAAVELYENGEA